MLSTCCLVLAYIPAYLVPIGRFIPSTIQVELQVCRPPVHNLHNLRLQNSQACLPITEYRPPPFPLSSRLRPSQPRVVYLHHFTHNTKKSFGLHFLYTPTFLRLHYLYCVPPVRL
ncbi:hypothetical protein GGS24DRAFT_136989 [Hypoxylon argillaceum]|nr:hypothetical protein GGS24DRAFT_136989 [Hypoxylon argillaceum]